MSILEEFEEVSRFIGKDKYNAIEKYLDTVYHKTENSDYYEAVKSLYKTLPSPIPVVPYYVKNKVEEIKKKYGVVLLDDVLYNSEEWDKFNKWYNENYLHRKVKILETWKMSHDDYRCNANIYQNNKLIANVNVEIDISNNAKSDKNIIKSFEAEIYKNFDVYSNLLKLSKCSKLLQNIYDDFHKSDSTMYFIDEEDWKYVYADKYNNNDIQKLKEEVKKYRLEKVLTIDSNKYIIVGWSNLETSFNDDRNIVRSKEYER